MNTKRNEIERGEVVEDSTLSAQESLKVIERMMMKTQENVQEINGAMSLIWGYVTVLVSLIVFFAYPSYGPNTFYAWFLIPVVGGILTLVYFRKNRTNVRYKTLVGKHIDRVWIIMGLTCWALSLLVIVKPIDMLFIVALMITLASLITAAIINNKVWITFAAIGLAMTVLMPLITTPNSIYKILYFAGIFFVTLIIPGHYLNGLKRRLLNTKA